jgi:uncharacterized FAD-dependent dehydrogenase
LKVVIVGAGPAGIFAAQKLSKKHEVTILENRSFVGGSGLHSDGKLNFHPQIGGDLTEFMLEEEAWELVYSIRDTFKNFGVELAQTDEEGLKKLETEASKAGIKFVKIEQNHIGSDHLPKVMELMQKRLEEQGVEIKLEKPAQEINVEDNKVISVENSEETYQTDAVLLAPGRIGSGWLIEQMKNIGVPMRYNPIDVGLRVEVSREVMDQVIHGYGCWDPKFHLYTPSYDDFVRTFCVCPAGFVVKEPYGNGLFGANGHSMRDTGSENTNFALLTRVSLTKPIENTTEYSTWERLSRSYVAPTMRDVTPGDISMAYPRRIVTNLMEGLEMLDRVMPGIDSDSTLLYGPEIKFYAMRIQTNKQLRTSIPNLYVAGDGAGVSRGIVGAAATGLVAAKGIMENLG